MVLNMVQAHWKRIHIMCVWEGEGAINLTDGSDVYLVNPILGDNPRNIFSSQCPCPCTFTFKKCLLELNLAELNYISSEISNKYIIKPGPRSHDMVPFSPLAFFKHNVATYFSVWFYRAIENRFKYFALYFISNFLCVAIIFQVDSK